MDQAHGVPGRYSPQIIGPRYSRPPGRTFHWTGVSALPDELGTGPASMGAGEHIPGIRLGHGRGAGRRAPKVTQAGPVHRAGPGTAVFGGDILFPGSRAPSRMSTCRMRRWAERGPPAPPGPESG